MVYNNGMFMYHTMAFMHPSMKRLYDSALHKLGDRLQADVARRMNVSSQVVSNWEKRGISQEGAIEAERAYGVSAAWLIDGKGNMLLSGIPKEIILSDSQEHEVIRKVDIRLSAGISGFAIEHLEEDGDPIVFRKNWLIKMGYKADKLVAVYVRGDSMEPGLHDKDTVVINTEDTHPQDGQVYAVNYEGELVIKRMIRDAGEWWLSSDNPDQRKHPRKVCQSPYCLVIGRVIHKQSVQI